MIACTAATWIEDGKTSLDDWEALTWSLGCTARRGSGTARVAITSLAFMLDEVPEPVWKTSIGNWSSCRPAITSSAAATMAVDDVRGQYAELGVGHRGRPLDLGQRSDMGGREPASGDREVLHRPLGLGRVQGVLRHPHLAHRVVLDPETGHQLLPSSPQP